MLIFLNIIFRRIWFMISCDFILYVNYIRLSKIVKFIIFDFSKFIIYKARRRLNVYEIYKNHCFKHQITLHTIIKSVFFYLIKNVLKVVIWSFDHVNLVYNNAIEMNFDDFLFNVLYFFLVFKFNFINMNSVDSRIHSLRIKLINVYNLNKEARFHKYVNLWCVRDWCSIVWFLNKNVHFQTCDDNKC